LELVGAATNFREYVENTYKPLFMAKTSQDRTRGLIANYVVPEFRKVATKRRFSRCFLSIGKIQRDTLKILDRVPPMINL